MKALLHDYVLLNNNDTEWLLNICSCLGFCPEP